MNALEIVLGIIILVAALFIIVAVLMQEGKSKGMGAVSGGSSETFFGKTKGKTWEKTLAKLTTIVGVVFVVAVLVLFIAQKELNTNKGFNTSGDSAETTAAAVTTAETVPATETTA